MATQPLLKAGLRLSIGSGNNTIVWSDNWIPDTKPQPTTPCGPSFNPNLRICDQFDSTSQGWNLPKLQSLISHDDIPLIQSLRLPRSSRSDGYCWAPTKSGAYTVQSGNCPCCGPDNETVNHLLFVCPPSVQVWTLAHIPHSLGLFPSTSNLSNLHHLLWRAQGLGIPSSILDNVP
ncbi:unnamed protein product [Brassica rapa subsp. narinosa]